jgi:tetratricopeptide (TPR) repeat protein
MRRDFLIGGGVFVLSLAVYTMTLCPSIYWEDSAAFCAVHSLLGIPHSPGFPLYVLLGRVFSLLPFTSSAFCSNLMSAFWGGATLTVLFFLILEIFGQPNIRQWLSYLTGSIAVLVFAFSSSFWLQTVRAEVYTLNLFLSLTSILFVLRWRRAGPTRTGFRWLLLFTFVLGLSLTNHPLLALTLAPAFLLLILCTDFKVILSARRLGLLAIFVLLGLSVYLYLPIRSSFGPAVNWGNPDSWPDLLAYLLRTNQAPVSPSAVAVPFLNRLWFNLSFPVDQFGLPLFWLSIVGVVSLFRSSRLMGSLTLAVFALNLGTATWAADFSARNYDLLGYLLPSLSMFTIWFALGTRNVLAWILKEVRAVNGNPRKEVHKVLGYLTAYVLLLTVILLPVLQLNRNLKRCDKSSQIWAQVYARQILSSVKKNTLILAGDDNTLTSLWYVNLAENRRPDVKIVSVTALTGRANRQQIKQQYPEIRLPDADIRDPGALAYELGRLNADKFPVYSTYFSGNRLLAQHLRPAGYLYRLSTETVTLTDSDIEEQRDRLRRDIPAEGYDVLTREHFGNLIFNLGAFYDKVSGSHLSVEYLLWALEVDPSNSRIYFKLGEAFLKKGDKVTASKFLQAGLELEPYNAEARRLLEQT